MTRSVTKVLQEEGFIYNYEEVIEGNKSYLLVS
eukprot:CAMPEP_0113954302 /NCGR_PEP_ID=MMETSP0011_2-20120614/439_1 /TAXON_ID=101924 /ORGANISM="Rhodosorus marinus" /LENGTH=32 /DNA_ID=CAMNT_0000963339 /DNA_START=1113 /DNA_END=1207 /DNA_ORIENTATION=+ /assembly_acc=CAM_ASM_000156